MSLSGKIAKNTIIQMVGKIVSTVLGLFSLGLITRYLGQEGYGEYSTIIAFLTIFAVIADFGLTLVTVQMISGVKEKEKEEHILNNLFSFRFVSIILLLLLAPLFLIFFPYSASIKFGILITAPYFIFPALTQIIVGLLQKRLSMDRAALAEVISRLFLIGGLLVVLHFKLGLNGVLIATVISGASSFFFHFLFARPYAKITFAWDWTLWKKIISLSWPLAVTIVLNLIYLRADIIFLSIFKGASEVGLYAAAYRVVDVLTTLPFMFAGLILPILTAAWLESKKEYFQRILQKSFDFMAILAFPLIVGGHFLAEPVIVAVAGEEFYEAGPILNLLIIAVAAIFLGTMFSHAVIALNKQRKLIVYYVFTSASSLAAYLILIPRFSYFGAAAVTIYSEALIAIFSAYCVYKYSRYFPKLKVLFKSMLASIIMGVFLYYYPAQFQAGTLKLILTISLASVIYFLFLFMFRGIKKGDLKAILKKSSSGQTYGPSGL